MAYHNWLGQQGETAAQNFLEKNGYLIREKNLHIYGIEVDIIAQKNNQIIFVEVKTRTNNLLPLDKLFSYTQRQRLIKAANYYVQKKQIDLDVRFDLILVTNNNGQLSIEHIEDAFKPHW